MNVKTKYEWRVFVCFDKFESVNIEDLLVGIGSWNWFGLLDYCVSTGLMIWKISKSFLMGNDKVMFATVLLFRDGDTLHLQSKVII